MPPEERSKIKWNDPRIDALATALETLHKLPENSLKALKYAENAGSDNASDAVSLKQAKGMMQFIPSTLSKYPHNVLDPVENLDAAARYFSDVLNKQYKGNVLAAFADYNGGPSQAKLVMEGKRPSFGETHNYMKKIQAYYKGTSK